MAVLAIGRKDVGGLAVPVEIGPYFSSTADTRFSAEKWLVGSGKNNASGNGGSEQSHTTARVRLQSVNSRSGAEAEHGRVDGVFDPWGARKLRLLE